MNLVALVQAGDLDAVRGALAERGLPEDGGAAALVMACRHLRPRMVEALLAAGADPGRPDASADPPLVAAAYGYGQGHRRGLATFSHLLDAGAPIDARNPRGWTALMVAAWHAAEQLLTLLLARGADPDLVDGEGKSALMLACEGRFVDFCAMFDNRPPPAAAFARCARTLLAAGADPELRDAGGRTARALAFADEVRAVWG